MIYKFLELLKNKRQIAEYFNDIYTKVVSLHDELNSSMSIPRISTRQINRANMQTNDPKASGFRF